MNYTQDLVFHGIPAVYRHLPPVRRRTATSAMSGPSDPYIPLSIRNFKVSETSTVRSAPSEQVQDARISEENSHEVRKVLSKKRKVLSSTRIRKTSSKSTVTADKKKRRVTPVMVEDSENAASPGSDVQPASPESPPVEGDAGPVEKKPRVRKSMVPGRKGWKGWIEGDYTPQNLILLDQPSVLPERTTRSGRKIN